MHHLAGADPKRQRAHATVSAGVAVAAHQQRAGRQAQLGSHHVHDPLAGLSEVKQAHARRLGIRPHAVEARRERRIGLRGAARKRGDDMVEGGKGQLRVADRQAPLLERPECLRAAVVHEMSADEKQGIPIAELAHHVPVPDFLKQRLRTHVCRLQPRSILVSRSLRISIGDAGWASRNSGKPWHQPQASRPRHHERTWCTSTMLPSGS
jgi:hypothetical protein